MTIQELYERVNELMPNQFEYDQIIYWLNIIEATVQSEVLGRVYIPENDEDEDDVEVTGTTLQFTGTNPVYPPEMRVSWPMLDIYDSVMYTGNEAAPEPEAIVLYTVSTDRSTELIVPPPFHDLYVNYVAGRMAYQNQETDAYTNYFQMFQGQYDSFKEYYVQTHPTMAPRIKNWF